MMGRWGGQLVSGFQAALYLERSAPQLTLPFPLHVVQDPGGPGTQEDDVRGIINDLLTGKQSSQGLLHDLRAIMPSAARPGPPPTMRLRSSPSPQDTPACGGLRRTDKPLQGLEVALELLMILPMCP